MRGELRRDLGTLRRDGDERLSPRREEDRWASRRSTRRARELREQRHLAEERAATEACEGKNTIVFAVRSAPRNLHFAARDDVRGVAGFSLLDDPVAPGRVDHLKRPEYVDQRLLGERTEQRQRREPRLVRADRLVVGALGRLQNLRRLRRQRGAGQERAERTDEIRGSRRRQPGWRLPPVKPGRPSTARGGDVVELLAHL